MLGAGRARAKAPDGAGRSPQPRVLGPPQSLPRATRISRASPPAPGPPRHRTLERNLQARARAGEAPAPAPWGPLPSPRAAQPALGSPAPGGGPGLAPRGPCAATVHPPPAAAFSLLPRIRAGVSHAAPGESRRRLPGAPNTAEQEGKTGEAAQPRGWGWKSRGTARRGGRRTGRADGPWERSPGDAGAGEGSASLQSGGLGKQ